MTIYEKADEIMYHYGLMEILKRYGEVHIVGSYRIGIMTWNDIDFYMDRRSLNAQNYYSLTSDIVRTMMPNRFDGEFKLEKEQAFLGFETQISGERWNVDVWWKGQAEIEASMAYAQNIVRLMRERPDLRGAVMRIKQDLMILGLYGFDKGKKHYHSREIYDAVFKEGILTTEQFLCNGSQRAEKLD